MLLAGQHRQFQAAGNAQLRIDIAEMALHGFFADRQFAGNFTIAVAFFDGRNNFDLAPAVVWGMPGELVKLGGADWILPLPDIASKLNALAPIDAPDTQEP